jgi:hypothetical protein
VLPRLRELGPKAVAEAIGISQRRARDILQGRALPHRKHRMALQSFGCRAALRRPSLRLRGSVGNVLPCQFFERHVKRLAAFDDVRF